MAPRKRNQATKTSAEKATSSTEENATAQEPQEQGIAGSKLPWRRLGVRLVLIMGALVLAYWFRGNQQDETLARSGEIYQRLAFDVPCSKDYEAEKHKFKECFPSRCGRVVMDGVVTTTEARELLRIAKAGLAHGGSNGGASILDLHSGALSQVNKFINIYAMMKNSGESIFSDEDFSLYKKVKNKIHDTIAAEFGVPLDKLYLTNPTFFSRMNTKPAQTIHDEYWHKHVDKETYGSFDYTSLLYLADYGSDFTGGRFIFDDKDVNRTVEPRLGRLSFFTSGHENVHHVEKVESGTRYAITVSFTCDPAKAISDPEMRQQSQ